MEKFSDIIEAVKNQQPVNLPDAFTTHVMARVEKFDQSAVGKITRYAFHTKKMIPDAESAFFGGITSCKQCAFLLLMVGFFYFVTGVVTTWEFHEVITGGNINPWLGMQPYFTIGSSLFILSAAFLISYRPQATIFIQYAMIIYIFLVWVNALILESILSLPVAVIYAFILNILVIGLSILLIRSIQFALADKQGHQGGNYA